jgi:CheY-like chemotaxis protein
MSGLRVLVVEDEPLIALALADLLEDLGCEVVGPACNLQEAEALGREAAVDGAILDVSLGQDKVFPVADILSERLIPFAFTTGYGEAGVRPSDRQRPILQKPYDPERLKAIVQRWRKA